MTTAKGPMNVLDCITLVMAEYMSVIEGDKPKGSIMNNTSHFLDEDSEERAGFIKLMSIRIKNMTSAWG